MSTAQQSPDPIDSVTSMEPLATNVEQNAVSDVNLTSQSHSVKEEKITTDASHKVNANTKSSQPDSPGQLGSENVERNQNSVYVPSIYRPQTQTFFYEAYDWPAEWEGYPGYINAKGLETGSLGVYHENPSLMYSPGYSFGTQMPYAPYSPATTPLPSASGAGPLFSLQPFPFSGTYYQQQPPAPTDDFSRPINQQSAFLDDISSTDGMLIGPTPGYEPSFGYLDGVSASPLMSTSPQPMLFGQRNTQLASGTAPQTHSPFYGFTSPINSFDRAYTYPGFYRENTSGVPFTNFGSTELSSNSTDKSSRYGKWIDSSCSCNSSFDFLIEQNRGPRATRSKSQIKDSSSDVERESSTAEVDRNLYNSPDFITDYKDARFFVIKSYSEDNVHKSIKYGVWASTSNGNKKLDLAYRETKEKEHCPVFLFFSVNASSQFCGVAEMVGPVDFEKSVDYWQQDKWNGQFPVKWHIVKDVPNNMFRHIILENNDNKPVTNSRDTQEFKLEQGQEMLSIFKNHEYETSVLDDFSFYEKREKALRERRIQQQQQPLANSRVLTGEHKHLGVISGDTINKMTKSFADVVRLDERGKANSTNKNSSPVAVENKKPSTARNS